MKTLDTLYFPDTTLLSPRQLPLLLLFSAVHVIDPVEENPQNQTMYTKNDFCQIHTPYPLGDDRERFLYLINDIQNRKDDYAAQLSHVTLASMSVEQGTGESSKHQILSSLLGNPDTAEQEAEREQNEKRWHNRLVLKIAEMLDREEEEVAQSLAFLEESESELFDRLKGEEDDEQDISELYDDLKNIRAKLSMPRVDSISKRLQAWFRYVDGSTLPECPVWSATRPEVADILFENHEKQHDQAPQHIASMAMPALVSPQDDSLEPEINRFKEALSDQLQQMMSQVTSATGDISGDSTFQKSQEEWRKQLDLHFPEKKNGRINVDFHLFSAALPLYSGVKTVEEQVTERPRILATFFI